MDLWVWLSFQRPSGGPGIGPGLGPGSGVLWIAPYPPPYEFFKGMAYCGPHVGLGLVPQGGLETLQPEGQAGAGVESNSEGILPVPCAVCLCAMKLEKVEPTPKEVQDMKALQKELDQITKLLKQKKTRWGTPRMVWDSPWAFFLERYTDRQPSAALRPCIWASRACANCSPSWRDGWRKPTTRRTFRGHAKQRSCAGQQEKTREH